jgi:hypothetical protein
VENNYFNRSFDGQKKIEKHCPRTKVCDITGVQMKSSQVGYEFLMKEDRAK